MVIVWNIVKWTVENTVVFMNVRKLIKKLILIL